MPYKSILRRQIDLPALANVVGRVCDPEIMHAPSPPFHFNTRTAASYRNDCIRAFCFDDLLPLAPELTLARPRLEIH